MTDFVQLRERMVRQQIAARGIDDPAILDAFRTVPREAFVAEKYADAAYDDGPLPIQAGQTISQPYIVALMIAAAEIGRGDHVLEVGAGSGYAAAVISRISRHVVAIERQPELVAITAGRIQRLGYRNIDIVHGDGTLGCPGAEPFDAILASATGHHIPAPLIEQLEVGGRLVMPIGGTNEGQQLVKAVKQPDGSLRTSSLGGVRFVPLIGEEGWTAS